MSFLSALSALSAFFAAGFASTFSSALSAFFAAGFASPLAIFAGFIFGKWLGVFFLALGMSIGASALYIFANYFLKEIIKDKFLTRFKNLEEKFKKSEFFYLLVYRFVGGIPFVLSNILPCIFNAIASRSSSLRFCSWWV